MGFATGEIRGPDLDGRKRMEDDYFQYFENRDGFFVQLGCIARGLFTFTPSPSWIYSTNERWWLDFNFNQCCAWRSHSNHSLHLLGFGKN